MASGINKVSWPPTTTSPQLHNALSLSRGDPTRSLVDRLAKTGKRRSIERFFRRFEKTALAEQDPIRANVRMALAEQARLCTRAKPSWATSYRRQLTNLSSVALHVDPDRRHRESCETVGQISETRQSSRTMAKAAQYQGDPGDAESGSRLSQSDERTRNPSHPPLHQMQLSNLGLNLSPAHLKSLAVQGFVSVENLPSGRSRRYKLRFRHGGRQCVWSLGGNAAKAHEVRVVLAKLQSTTRARRELTQLGREMQRLMRDTKTTLQPIVADLGLRYHGYTLRSPRRVRSTIACRATRLQRRLATSPRRVKWQKWITRHPTQCLPVFSRLNHD